MRVRLWATVVSLGATLAAAPAAAHHSFAAEYDASKPIAFKGTVTKMLWSNPHGWIYLDVKAPDGKIVNWAVELGGVNALFRRGWRKEDLPPGTMLSVEGFLAKDGSPTVNGANVTLPDGKRLFAGSSAPGGLAGTGEK